MTAIVFAALLMQALSSPRSRADEIFMPRHYAGTFTFYNMHSQEARLELEPPVFDVSSNKLLADGLEWYHAAGTWYSIPIKIEIDTDTFRFALFRQISQCDNAVETPSVDPLVGVITSDFRKIVNDLSGEGEHALEDFVFKAVPPSLMKFGPRAPSRCSVQK